MDGSGGSPVHNSRFLGGRQVDIEPVLVFLVFHCFDTSWIGLGGRNPVVRGCVREGGGEGV